MELLIDIGISQSRSIILKDNNPRAIFIENSGDENISGNIYKGKVETLVKSLNCAFVKLSEGKKGLLHLEDATKELKKGDEVLVQVIREPSGDKGARLSMDISISSKNIVLLVNCNEINISRKIKNEPRRKELHEIGKSIVEENNGVIFRTKCEDISNESIVKEYNYIKNIWRKMKKDYPYIKGEKLLYNPNGFLNHIKKEYINSNIEKIYINRKEERKDILGFIEENNFSIEVADIKDSIEKNRLIRKVIEYALEKKFNSEEGSNIVVDETEALAIIDINSASSNKASNIEEHALNINLNSLDKISEIIALRNLSGIILIDFINMKKKASREKVKNTLIESFDKFNIKAKPHNFTELGILEISKAKKGKGLSCYVRYNPSYYTLKNLENDILKTIHKKKIESININVDYNLYNLIKSLDFIGLMKKYYNVNLDITKMKDIKDYLILGTNVNFARITVGERKIFGEIKEFLEDENVVTIKVKK